MARRKKDTRSPEFLRKIAIHEAGHAVYAWVSPYFQAVNKVTIKAKRNSDGLTDCDEQDETQGRQGLTSEIACDLAGLVAEELTGYVRNEGASDDLIEATKKAKRMVRKLALGRRVGFRVISKHDQVSAGLQSRIDLDIDEILKEAYRLARRVIGKYLGEVEAIALTLTESMTIGPKELEEILGPKA